jgi:hypothetical protein
MSGSTLKTVFKDAQMKPSSGSSDASFEGDSVTLLQGDAEINGNKLVIGFNLSDNIVSPD